MNKFLLALSFLVFASSIFATELIHPLEFRGTDEEKQRVIAYIEQNVKETYTAIGMGDPSTLRMMENEELNSFKALIKIENRDLLDNVIRQYCSIGMCNYSTILMMYNEQNRASNQKLEW